MTLGTVALKNVLVMGASYGDLYVLPRYAVISGHEDKAFVPYTSLFGSAPHHHTVIHGTITRLERNRVTYTPAAYDHDRRGEKSTLEFEYAVYALGARLPAPIDLWGTTNVFGPPESGATLNLDAVKLEMSEVGTKRGGIEWLKKAQRRTAGVSSVLIVGGGALGIQFATDLKEVYPTKNVTLLHSRERLLPKFVQGMHDKIHETMADLGVTVLLGERLDLQTTLPENAEYNERGERIVKTVSGRGVAADLVLLCTGQRPNTDLVRQLAPDVVDEATGLVRVLPSLQLSRSARVGFGQTVPGEKEADLSHIFAIGDAADVFGDIKAGHTAWFQGEAAAKNILALIKSKHDSEPPRLEGYTPGNPGIKVSLGMRRYIIQSRPEQDVKIGEDGKDDLDAGGVWPFWGADYERDKDK
ncbi:hypothetical protein FRC10_005387 [Ceratobasidium sp. 414]|nr:hypothetical protein FRC10_005387 [Ceratobasidium sp. 414]